MTQQLEGFEAEIETLQSEEFEEILEKHRTANQIEFEIGRLNSDLEDTIEEIEEIEERLDEHDDLETEREEVKEALVDMRTRIEQIETRAVEQFSTHIETVLDLLDHENLDRIWIERIERCIREGDGRSTGHSSNCTSFGRMRKEPRMKIPSPISVSRR